MWKVFRFDGNVFFFFGFIFSVYKGCDAETGRDDLLCKWPGCLSDSNLLSLFYNDYLFNLFFLYLRFFRKL
ncbi:hypothetical protein [Chryseobacterium gossypii]|uniref:hypothetical protein n=1 Tax=Chryseobacterium gossypii TaxID=3231602 RepID=UPI0035253F65